MDPAILAAAPAGDAGRLTQLDAELQAARADAARARQQLAALTEHLREGLLLFDASQHVVLLNERMADLFGLARPVARWVGQPLDELAASVRDAVADPAAYDEGLAHLRRLLLVGASADTSLLPLRDGRILERDVLQVQLGDDQGWLFTYRDVTDRQRAAQERDAQRHFYETVLDELPVEVAVLDERRRYVYVNPQAEPDPEKRAWLLSGHTVVEFCERYGFPVSLGEHRHRMFDLAQTSDEPIFWDDHTPLPGGDVVHQRQFKRLRGAGRPGRPYMLGAGLDVTARVRAEEQSLRAEAARREQRQFTEQVLDTVPSAIFVRNADGQLAFSNFRMAELVGQLHEPGTVAPAGHPWQLVSPEPLPTALDPEPAAEHHLTLPDGSSRWFQTVRRLLERPDGRRQVLGVSTDITDLKAAQLAAEAAAEARETFLANISHEIRTPMNGVLGVATLLAKTDLTPQQRDFLRTIRSSGTHLLGLLNDVLDVAKIQAGKLELEQTPFDLPDAVAQAIAPLALQAEAKGLAFAFERPPGPLWVRSDAFRLNQVLLNLLSNALKFTDSGQVVLRLHPVGRADDGQLQVRFEVQDTGIGIKPEALARIFESFAQAEAHTSRRYGGTGLGLSISQALVRQLGGELHVSSDYGWGSIFAFELPLPPAEAVPAAAAPPPEASRLRHCRVLLAEDNDVNRLVASLHLTHWGAQVDEAADGPTAWQLLEAQRYDAVLMDIQMPGLSGLDVTRRLRQHPDPRRAATPVLALTANAFASHNEKYLAAGFNDYLAKPFAEEVLYTKLVAMLHPAAAPPRPYDLSRLRHDAQGQPAFVARMVQAFRQGTPPVLREIGEAAARRAWLRVAELAHHLKPNLHLLAIEAALAPALLLETPPAPADEPRHQTAVRQLTAAVEKALQALAEEEVNK